ncbi:MULTISPECIES: diaminopimelate decarboxylase [Prochlorococcus]|uniref:Diaminopimelate decarboxylase n=1 Tax=Prochlorococcus marinus (strain SARG / CCMP1375 / SS120) TaxID=167539 RepID=Q7VBI7_PROMA|nr:MULTISPECIES: diaminopimelate decarboxylase [Prochlorococcus]AAQ00150.1 Diaminopimelate decarboxylase [Prochlorococcus marinus subsp. marinus str. CCMP1375]KGG13946.1 Diaminopimelate decarboxylase [Prochlorococcus marinus str. LG]KGG19079.1 Diaminopimelate decarboxylase [Prochlorococcus marinus str. SS2]KGG23381.1 Diaminopimelate decarboxylase [Prochlorococcus marinus str. SS35]KGG32383.1 Diaminopimelate decarboxylase [Prochlorococcus marinus str. SS51]
MAILRPFEKDQDKSSPNRNIAPITAALDSQERLSIGGCLLSSLAEKYGTPLYILDELTLRTSCREYKDALSKYYPGDSIPLYASKANSSLIISNIVASEGMGVDVVSEGELITALKGGVESSNIVFHGNNKSKSELIMAYKNDVIIVLDNQYDIDQLREIVPFGKRKAKLMLRFTPGIECHTHEYIKTGHIDSKFGFDPDELESIFLQFKDIEWGELIGLHAHIGSQIFEVQPHKDLADVMASALQTGRKLGHSLNALNLGGGLGIRYIASDDPPSISDWVEVIAAAVVKACRERSLDLPLLMCEPGRSIVGSAGLTLYKIGSRKEIPGIKTYLSVDGGMSDNPRPITYQSEYSACLVDKPLIRADEVVTIAGKHCESGDVLLKDFRLPRSNSGDVLGVFSTGAYNFSMSSNYNRIPKPAAIIVGNGESELIQKRELPEDLLRNDILPDRFIAKG